MSKPKRLHPVSAVINFLKSLKELIFPFVFIFLFGGNGISFNFWQVSLAVVFILLSLVTGVLSWLRFTYRVEDGELRIESGLFVRKKRYIPFERIQSLDLSEGILQRPFGLVRVRVETAGSSGLKDAEAVLTAITKTEAEAIQDILASVKYTERVEMEDAADEAEVIYKIKPSQLLLLASTSGGAGVVISAAIAFIAQFDELIPYKKMFEELQGFISSGVVFVSTIVFLIFLLAWLVAVVGTIMKYAGFTVKKVDDDLIISRGLLEKRQLTIPLNRVQGILICENIIRQPLGFGSVYIESAGGSQEGDGSKALILPIIKKKEIAGLLSPFLADYHFRPDIVPSPKRALKRYMFRNLIIPLFIVVVSLIFFQPWGYLSLLLIPVGAIWAFLEHKDAGWNVQHQQLTLTYRGIVKRTILMKKNKIQSLSVSRSYFQKRQELTSIKATIKSGIGGSGGTVVDIEKRDGHKVYIWYKHT
ncbi:PH domain-containing protein [Bacillus sp. V3B]|nr:PH domain-containing protein [Bacillus sp. V3B]